MTLGWASVAQAQFVDILPVVKVEAVTASVTEGTREALQFRLSRTGSSDAELSFRLRYRSGPSAVFSIFETNMDFTVRDHFEVGETEITLPIYTIDNDVDEADGWLEVTVLPSEGSTYAVGEPSSVRLTVIDDDEPPPAAVIESLTLTSDPNDDGRAGDDDTYAIGDEIEVTVAFDRAVTVTGTPELTLIVGSGARRAQYRSGSGSAELVFVYDVAEHDADANGVAIDANAVNQAGGSIKTGGESADLTHGSVAEVPGHLVDGVRPGLTDTAVDGATVSLTYSEVLDQDSTLAADRFTVFIGVAETPVTPSSAAVSGRTVTLTLPAAIVDNVAARLSYSAGAVAIRDAVGNAASGIDGLNLVDLPIVTIEALTGTVSFSPPPEADIAEFRVSRTGSTAKPLQVKLGWVEGGFTGDDAVFVTLRAGASSRVSKHFVIDKDDDDQPLPTITFQVEPHDGYLVGEPGMAIVQVSVPARQGRSPDDLTADFTEIPSAHAGFSDFTVGLEFSEPIGNSYRVLRDHALEVTGGWIKASRRVNGRSDLWEITVRALSREPVDVRLVPGKSCEVREAICTKDDRLLANEPTVRIPGPGLLSVADARAREDRDAAVRFHVTLDRSLTETVTVDYTTRDGSAKAGEDYEATSGTITLRPGSTEFTVEVPILDDGRDEGEEEFSLHLSDVSGAWLEDGSAVGRIVNSDPLPSAWLTRFGRTTASHIVDAVSERVSEAPVAGSGVVVGGATPESSGLAGGSPLRWDHEEAWTLSSRSLRNDDWRRVLAGSSFRWSSMAESETSAEDRSAPGWTAWGRGAATSFDGGDDEAQIDGDVVTGTMGVDYERGRTLSGLALSYSDGSGEFQSSGSEGRLASSLTSINPYLRVTLNERLDVWGLLGYGRGDLTLRDDGEGRLAEIETDTGMRTGAVGLRGSLLSGSAYDLAIRSDAFWVRMDSDATAGLRSAAGDASVLRVALEGSRHLELERGGVLQPSLELGLRYDGGDGETGGGLEFGGALRYTNPTRGLIVALNARSLLAHEASGFDEWGFGGSVRVDPGTSGRGLSLDVRSTVGAVSSGAQRLWSEREMAALGRNGAPGRTGRVEAELGYGVGIAGGRGLLAPYGAVSAAHGVQAYAVGSRLLLGESFSLGLEASRRERDSSEPETTLALRARWRLPGS